MARNWKFFALCSILAASPTVAVAQDNAEDLKKIYDRIDQMQQTLSQALDRQNLRLLELEAKKGYDDSGLRQELQKLGTRVGEIDARPAAAPTPDDSLKLSVRELEQKLKALEERKPAGGSDDSLKASIKELEMKVLLLEKGKQVAEQPRSEESWRSPVRELDARLRAVEDRKPAPAAADDSVMQTLRDIRSRLQALEERKLPALDQDAVLRSLEKLNTQLNDKLDRLNGRIRTLDESISKAEKEVSRLLELESKTRGELDAAKSTISRLELQINLLSDEVKRAPSASANPMDKAALEDFRGKLGAIEQAILKLQPERRVETQSPERPWNSATPPAVKTGRVMLVNLYNEEMLFVVNGQQHRVPPQKTLSLDAVPAGALSYEVISPTWGSRSMSNTTLGANDTFTLTAR